MAAFLLRGLALQLLLLLLLSATQRAASQDARRECLEVGTDCKRLDFSKPFCAPLELDEDRPIDFNIGVRRIHFPTVPTIDERFCTNYLNKYPWVAKEQRPGLRRPKWHRDDWVPGTCDCSRWKGEDPPPPPEERHKQAPQEERHEQALRAAAPSASRRLRAKPAQPICD